MKSDPSTLVKQSTRPYNKWFGLVKTKPIQTDASLSEYKLIVNKHKHSFSQN